MIDMGKWVDGIWVIQDYSQKEQRDRRKQIERETQEERKPMPEIPLTEADIKKQYNRRMNRQHEADLRNGIDRS